MSFSLHSSSYPKAKERGADARWVVLAFVFFFREFIASLGAAEAGVYSILTDCQRGLSKESTIESAIVWQNCDMLGMGNPSGVAHFPPF